MFVLYILLINCDIFSVNKIFFDTFLNRKIEDTLTTQLSLSEGQASNLEDTSIYLVLGSKF